MIDEMHIFATVVEQSSLNKASVLLNLSQPALSRKIARLESDLGVQLFRRAGRRLELTRIGRMTYEYALELRQLHLRYLNTLAEYNAVDRRSVTIGASLTTLQSTLPDLIQALTTANPRLDIKAVTGKTHEIVSLIRERKVDLGIVASGIDDPSLASLPLFEDHLVLVLPRNMLIMEQEKLEIVDLDKLPMILFSKGTWYRILTDELFHMYHLAPDVKMEIDSFEAILRLLNTCRAATVLPKSYLRQQLLVDNELIAVTIKELEQAKRTTSLVHVGLPGLPPSFRSLIEQIKAHFAKQRGQ